MVRRGCRRRAARAIAVLVVDPAKLPDLAPGTKLRRSMPRIKRIILETPFHKLLARFGLDIQPERVCCYYSPYGCPHVILFPETRIFPERGNSRRPEFAGRSCRTAMVR